MTTPPPVPDKRDECGCHRTCTVLPHDCERPCRWPACLTPQEEAQLAEELAEDVRNGLL